MIAPTPVVEVPTPSPLPVGPARTLDPMRDVEDAIRLLHECMRAAMVRTVLINGDEVTLTYVDACAGAVSLHDANADLEGAA